MRKKWWMFLLIPPVIVLVGWIFGEIVMHLWNWLLPPLFGWHTVGFWQALGLLVLCRILFGGFRNGAPNGGSAATLGRTVGEDVARGARAVPAELEVAVWRTPCCP